MSRTSGNRDGVRVEVSNLRKCYGDHEVLHELEFEVHRSEIFVVMGPSGSGKSVLLRHLIGLERPDAGEILNENEPVQAPGVQDKYRLAMVFQSGGLLESLTVGENVGLYLSEHRLRPQDEIDAIVAKTLTVVGLEGKQDRFPAELSGGMKKRVAIARALVIEPQLILYDEPTSELDPLMAVTIGREIIRLQQRIGVTSIVVSHDRDLAFGVADRIALINQGKILMIGSPDEVKRCDLSLVREFLDADFKSNQERSFS